MDTLQGDNGNDILLGGDGDDYIYGGFGNDYAYGGAGNDVINGGWYDYSYASTGGADTVFGGSGDDQITAYDSIAVENQIASGDEGDDTIYSGAGNDWLFGGSGNDVIVGGAGNDYLASGFGSDYLYGGQGSDYFDLADALVASNFDFALDFSYGEDYFLLPAAYTGQVYYGVSGNYAYGSISMSGNYYSFGVSGLTVAQLQASVFFV